MTLSRTDFPVTDADDTTAPPNPDAELIAHIAELDLERRRAVRELEHRQVTREMQRRGLLPPDDDAGQGEG